jgi:hypothetical protein
MRLLCNRKVRQEDASIMAVEISHSLARFLVNMGVKTLHWGPPFDNHRPHEYTSLKTPSLCHEYTIFSTVMASQSLFIVVLKA